MSNSRRAFLNYWSQLGRDALPQCCLLCGARSHADLLCSPCGDDLPRLAGPLCRTCAVPVPRAGLCGACLQRAPHFDRVCAVFAYGFPVDALIHALKYSGSLAAAVPLGRALAGVVASERVDLVVAMPLSARRLRERGFNQAQEIARSVRRAIGVPLAIDICRRVTDTGPQAALPWKERAGNVRGAFVCDADLSGLTVAVVDDVMTTGSTLNELARTLRRAGAVAVRGWVVARALRQD